MQVTEVLPDYAPAFPFDEFNAMQREALPVLLTTDHNVVACAPTASGKTALAELAICKTLDAGGRALFIAPLRALTNEKERDWERFQDLGHSVYVVTGERDLNPRRAARADVLVMTPEKVDSATRKPESSRYGFITDIDCCVIDEAHLLDSSNRGAVLEVTIARLRRLCDPRIIALSATLPNIGDVAEWLDCPPEATFAFGDAYRPVELNASVETYTHGDNAFADKYRRLYRALDLIAPHVRDDGQALVFVASRQDTVHAAEKAREELPDRDIEVGGRGSFDFHEATQALANGTLRECVLDGVAFHHAGLSRNDKDRVEAWFRDGQIAVLFSTSTLAWGVNLPARCVVIRDTKYHHPLDGEVDMSPVDLLQMLGRAGRPQYDDVGYGWIICDGTEADRYRRLVRDGTPIESRLAADLDAHLVAEIALGTIRDIDDVMAWLETTYYAVRARSKPDAYGYGDVRDRVSDTLGSLIDRGFVETDGVGLSVTPLGRLASAFYVRLETAARFHELATDGSVTREAVLRSVATAAEFDSVSTRRDERDAVRSVIGRRDLDPGAGKVLAILESSTGGTVPDELASDAWVIRNNALRLLGALGAFFDEFGSGHGANRVRRIEAQVEHGVAPGIVGLTAIDGVSAGRAHRLASDGIESPSAVRAAGVDGLVAAGLAEGVAAHVYREAAELPIIRVEWGGFPDRIGRGQNEVREVVIETTGGPARVSVRVRVNGVEMVTKTASLDPTASVPVGIYGADAADTLEFSIAVAVPDLPLHPTHVTRTVTVGPTE